MVFFFLFQFILSVEFRSSCYNFVRCALCICSFVRLLFACKLYGHALYVAQQHDTATRYRGKWTQIISLRFSSTQWVLSPMRQINIFLRSTRFIHPCIQAEILAPLVLVTHFFLMWYGSILASMYSIRAATICTLCELIDAFSIRFFCQQTKNDR